MVTSFFCHLVTLKIKLSDKEQVASPITAPHKICYILFGELILKLKKKHIWVFYVLMNCSGVLYILLITE